MKKLSSYKKRLFHWAIVFCVPIVVLAILMGVHVISEVAGGCFFIGLMALFSYINYRLQKKYAGKEG